MSLFYFVSEKGPITFLRLFVSTIMEWFNEASMFVQASMLHL